MDFLGIYTLINNTDDFTETLNNLGYNMRESEFLDFKVLVDLILETKCMSYFDLVEYTGNFTFGFEIPRIGKEFDLLRLGKNYNINIEIKNSSSSDRKRKQIETGAYYLKSLKTPTLYYSFDVEEESILFGDPLEDNISFRTIGLDEMVERIKDQEVDYTMDIRKVLTPEQFLVNPFTDTNLFLEHKYFLNAQQQNIFNDIIDDISKSNLSPVAIEGGPGTGKSLLLYSLSNYLNNKESIIVHSGNLNYGHDKLIEHKFNIYPAKDVKKIDYSDIKYIFIDEAQRTYIHQLNTLFEIAEDLDIKLLFFFDPKQTFSEDESGSKNKEMIVDYTKKREGRYSKLGKIVRSNHKIVEFINQMFQFNINEIKTIENLNQEVIIKYYNSFEDFLGHESKIIFNDYALIGYASSRYKKDKYFKYSSYGLPHDTVGQEYDKVAVIIDKDFYYKGNKPKTTYRLNAYNDDAYYSGVKMLYNNVTRAREKLFIAVVDNPEVYSRLLSLLDNI